MTSDKSSDRRQHVLYFATESRMMRGANGVVYSTNPNDWYENQAPWLRTFDRLVVIARVADVEKVSGRPVEGPRVKVEGVPNYMGVSQLLLKHRSVWRAVLRSCDDQRAYYGGRFPGILSSMVLHAAKRMKAPVLAHVVGDPKAVLSSGVLGLTGRVLAFAGGVGLKRQIRRVDAAIYVTQQQLQAAYPVRAGRQALGLTDVVLPPDAFAESPREYGSDNRAWKIVAVGSQDQLYKGHDLLISALGDIRASGVDATLDLVGAGKFHSQLRQLAESSGVAQYVTFHGHVPSPEQVRVILDQADVFVMPSRTEGVPRALIEAMARGLPCLGSQVGGIPELLPSECLFPSGSATAVAESIIRATVDPAVLSKLSGANIEHARRIAANASAERLDNFLSTFVRAKGGL